MTREKWDNFHNTKYILFPLCKVNTLSFIGIHLSLTKHLVLLSHKTKNVCQLVCKQILSLLRNEKKKRFVFIKFDMPFSISSQLTSM